MPVSAAGQRGDHGQQDGHLDADGPREVAGDFLIEGGDAAAELSGQLRAEAIDLGVEGVDPPLDTVDPALEPIEPTVESLYPTFQSRHPFDESRLRDAAPLQTSQADLRAATRKLVRRAGNEMAEAQWAVNTSAWDRCQTVIERYLFIARR